MIDFLLCLIVLFSVWQGDAFLGIDPAFNPLPKPGQHNKHKVPEIQISKRSLKAQNTRNGSAAGKLATDRLTRYPSSIVMSVRFRAWGQDRQRWRLGSRYFKNH